MSTTIKICGLNSGAAVRAAAAADFAGFVLYPPSPRNVTALEAGKLAAKLAPGVRRVAVMVDPDDATLRATFERFKPDVLQLHGSETPARVANIRAAYGVAIIKAVPVRAAGDLDAARDFEACADWLMFDAKPPRLDALPGGNAAAFDWTLLAGRAWRRPWFLSGGLTPANVAGAIATTGAPGVDVSSGVEAKPGHKDPTKITAFIAAVRRRSVAGTTAAIAR
ncbi:MAG TPA: phosphoribosylanthranilate isomerase [Alphaproteobacteria bacterium]|nr:phosphoribosylanthranilate isomerase [Alphaproteobacteria bacterium]